MFAFPEFLAGVSLIQSGKAQAGNELAENGEVGWNVCDLLELGVSEIYFSAA
jgi:hypothetical protein